MNRPRSPELIGIADTTRSYALALHWPGIGYWSWTSLRWGAAPLGPDVLLPLAVEGGASFARPELPVPPVPVLLELHVLGPDGSSLGPLDVETLSPAPIPPAAPHGVE
jgi:hypothetical protein